MLDFFRRYERYFFLVITVVIIISFSFFGTYSSLSSSGWRDQIAFKAVNGREVTRSEVDEMAIFLSTDIDDKQFYGGAWGPNFLNDGVIRKDFLETGLGAELALAFQEDLQEDIEKRLAKEKKYPLYIHPEARYISVENIWQMLAPEMNDNFEKLKAAQNGLDLETFTSRVKLYLGEKQLPASTLRYMLMYQERQNKWLKPDDMIKQADFSLFGYHTLEDWFGPRFTRLISEFIINTAIMAEAKGYQVSKEEALADLIRHTQTSYQQNQNNPNLGVTSVKEYLNEQLRYLSMDQVRAIKIWRQVLLFRRYFHDAGASALVDTIANQQLQNFAGQNVTIDLYRLPTSLRLSNKDDLKKFEIYLYAATKQNKTDPLALPQHYLTPEEIAKNYPELMQKKYKLEIAQIDQNTLQARIALRELWNWEIEDKNWQSLIKLYPILAVNNSDTRQERLEALDNLDSTTRSVVDRFAKQEIVKSHPDWINQALTDAKTEIKIVGLRIQGGKMPFSGLEKKEKRKEFIDLLDQASLEAKPFPESPLYQFTADDQNYYRISVLDRASESEILTFDEAKNDGTIDLISDRLLEKFYMAKRELKPAPYQNEKKEWKSFKSIRDEVNNHFLEKVLTALEPIQKSFSLNQESSLWRQELAATYRFYNYMKNIKESLESSKSSHEITQWIKESDEAKRTTEEALASSFSLPEQWKIEKATVTLNRQNKEDSVDISEAFSLKPQDWSPLKVLANGDLTFYQVKEHNSVTVSDDNIGRQVKQAQALLGAEAQRHLMKSVLSELKQKNAMSLAYLKLSSESFDDELQPIDFDG